VSGKHGRARTVRRPAAGPSGRSARAAPGPGRGTGGPAAGQPWAAAAGSRAIFRKEALEFHARGQEDKGGVVRLGAPWLRRAYRLTLVLVLGGAAAVALTPARQSSYGPAVVQSGSGRFAALFPAAVAPDLGSATGLSFALPGAGLRPARVTAVHVRLASPQAAGRAGLPAPGQPSILVTGRLLAAIPAAGRLRTRAAVILPTRPLAAVLGGELKVMLGQGGRP